MIQSQAEPIKLLESYKLKYSESEINSSFNRHHVWIYRIVKILSKIINRSKERKLLLQVFPQFDLLESDKPSAMLYYFLGLMWFCFSIQIMFFLNIPFPSTPFYVKIVDVNNIIYCIWSKLNLSCYAICIRNHPFWMYVSYDQFFHSPSSAFIAFWLTLGKIV